MPGEACGLASEAMSTGRVHAGALKARSDKVVPFASVKEVFPSGAAKESIDEP